MMGFRIHSRPGSASEAIRSFGTIGDKVVEAESRIKEIETQLVQLTGQKAQFAKAKQFVSRSRYRTLCLLLYIVTLTAF